MTRTRLIRAAAGLAAAVALVGFGAARADDPFKMISLDEVSKLVQSKDAHVLDANSKDVYAKAHLPGARHVVYDKVTEKDLPARKDAKLVFYCKNPG